MAWADDIKALNLKINRQQRFIDYIEGENENLFGPRGDNADPDNPLHIDGCDPADTDAAAHRWRGTGGGDAYFAWWRSQYPDADENSAGKTGEVFNLGYKLWVAAGSSVANMDTNSSDLSSHKATRDALIAKRDALQAKIDNGDPDGDPNA